MLQGQGQHHTLEKRHHSTSEEGVHAQRLTAGRGPQSAVNKANSRGRRGLDICSSIVFPLLHPPPVW